MNESEVPRHEMVLQKATETGGEEWYCPVCGRRFIMNWPPDYKRVILEPGDEYALHVGGRGGVGMNSPATRQTDDLDLIDIPEVDKAALAPWIKWMDEVNFEDLWNKDY